MSELSLKQIEDKLNGEFVGDSRKIVFWYDEKKEFIDDIEALNLGNVKKHYLTGDNSFKTKLLIEKEDRENSYLIYAPFEKPDSRENHLTDIIKYSKEFFADRISLIALDLGINEKGKRVLEKYPSFFKAQNRTARFCNLEGLNSDENTIEIALLSAVVKSKVINFEEVVRIVLTSGDIKDNVYLEAFKRYNLETVFWKHINLTFSFTDEYPTLEKFLISLFITYTNSSIEGELPLALGKYILNKSGTVVAFMDQMMNNILYRNEFDILSEKVFANISGEDIFRNFSVEDIIDLDIFKFVDEKIIAWVIDRLLDENLNLNINNMNISDISKYREEKHFGEVFYNEYHLLKHAYYIISKTNYKPESNLISIIERYDKEDYKIDTYYRKFNYYLDNIREKDKFDELKELVENIYTNIYLDNLSREFIDKFNYDELRGKYKLQRDFYRNYVANTREMLVVIISDGFRYEVAKELVKKMNRDKKFENIEIEPQVGIIPTYTRLGMASLLPHKELTIDDKYDVFVDGKPCANLIERDKILKHEKPDAGSINYDVLKKYKKEELRDFFVGKSLVYIYHNQIDNRGEVSEDEVFVACKEAIDEIMDIIIRLTDTVSRTRYIVTADHGFIYKRNKTTESDKIDNFFSKEDNINKRFILSDKSYDLLGTKSLMVADILGTYDNRTITVPVTSNIFKVAGGGQNYVHGGSSPQEVLIPVIQVKTIRGYKESRNVGISLISMLPKVTGLKINLDFIQQEPISDVVKPTSYKISFIDEVGIALSNEEIYLANSKGKDSAKRIFRLRFNLKNQSYNRYQKYYLVVTDIKTGVEAFRHQVIVDIAFSDNNGFDV